MSNWMVSLNWPTLGMLEGLVIVGVLRRSQAAHLRAFAAARTADLAPHIRRYFMRSARDGRERL
eukprot:8107530-Lingulodinium_polyedra.AAC.1